jgi:Cu(I)/Ag(I) efflux system membrane fusion protein
MLVVAALGEKITCPVCGTHLVGREAAQPTQIPEGYVPILIGPQKRRLMGGIRTVSVEKGPLIKTIRVSGQIAYDPELYQAQAEYLEAWAALKRMEAGASDLALEQAHRLVEAARLRLRLMGLDDRFIEEIERSSKPDQRLLLADEKGQVWLYAYLYESELPFVRIGQQVKVDTASLLGRVLEGEVRSVDPILNPTTRTARLRILLTDPQRLLRPQMYVNVTLMVNLGEGLRIPKEALLETGTRRIVFVDRQEGWLEPREVTIGAQSDEWVEVVNGLKAGERVVASGNFLIDSESRLKAALGEVSKKGEALGDAEHTGHVH